MTVPEELRPILNTRELVAPLGTDKRQAERQALAVFDPHERGEDARPG